MSRWDAIVVGAGVCGLAAAYELARRDRRVLVLEAEAVGAGQSAGLARIFRIAHADPRLCALALEAGTRAAASVAASAFMSLATSAIPRSVPNVQLVRTIAPLAGRLNRSANFRRPVAPSATG